MKCLGLATVVCCSVWTTAVLAGTGPDAFSGQLRPRFEYRNPDGNAGADHSTTSMRSRGQLAVSLEREVSVLVQIQDVRAFGSETNTLTDFAADGIDFHQAYVHFGHFGGYPLDLRLGRQEISLGGQRLLGAVNWTQQGRAFDGARITSPADRAKFDLLGIRLGDSSAPAHADDAYLVGAYAGVPSLPGAEAYAFYNWAGTATDQITVGARQAGSTGSFKYRLEGSYQFGDRAGEDVSAYMVGARLGRSMGSKDTRVTLWYDLLSGDDDPGDGDTKVFDTLFATNHKFYGYADHFLNIPGDTAGLGLQDAALKFTTKPSPATSLGIDGHVFLVAQKGSLDSSHLGEEVDLTLKCRYSADVTWIAGLSYTIADDALGQVGGLKDNAVFGYLMTDVRF